MRKQKPTTDPLEGLSLEQVVHHALGRAKAAAEMGAAAPDRSLEEAAAWANVAQAAATFHLSLTLGRVLDRPQ